MKLFALIQQTDIGEFDDPVLCSETNLIEQLRAIGNCFLVVLDLPNDCTKFYTSFSMELWDNDWPFGNLFMYEFDRIGGGEELVWVRDGEHWQAYDVDDYEELDGNLSDLCVIMSCPV